MDATRPFVRSALLAAVLRTLAPYLLPQQARAQTDTPTSAPLLARH